jgi:cholest-4-en-3-one 26-monooxygenase
MTSTMDLTGPAQDDINLASPAFFGSGDPHPIWQRLRAKDPIHLTKTNLKKPFWSVTRYEDAKFVLMNDNRFFSIQRSGANLPAGPEFEDPESSLFTKLSQSGQQLAVMDGMPHSTLRRCFSDRFSPSGVRSLEHLVRTVTHDALDEMAERGECDFTTDFAGRVPVSVIAAMMDIPKDHWADLYRWNNMLAAPEDPEFSIGTPLETSTHAVSNILNTCADLAEERRGRGGTDLLTALTVAEVNGKLLTRTEIGFNGLMFFAAGHETTRSSMSTGMIELIRDPAQFDFLRHNRHALKVLRTAAEEFVRYSSPLTHTLRTATEDAQIGGQPIKEGEWVVVWFHAANRDETVFENPERFDVTRAPNPHLGFAVGKHFCLGAHLARLDMQIMLEAMLERMDDVEFAGPIEMSSSNLFWGIKHMPIRFRGRARTGAPKAAL